MRFDEVIGQEDVKQRLLQMTEEDRIPNTMLFCGPMGCGKMALALAFASYLLGDRENGDPKATAMLRKWEHPDLHFIYPVIRPAGTSAEHKMISDDFAKEWNHLLSHGPYFTMDQWLNEMNATSQQAIIGAGESDSIIRKLSLKSSQGGYKICIIWLPERMNQECANKLLKLLEEPPMQTLFILVCEEPEKLLETILSRAQRIDFKRISEYSIQRALVQKRGIDEENARRIARLANGNWMQALNQLDASNENRGFLDMFMMLMRLAYKRDIRELKKWSEISAGYGREKQKRMFNYFSRMIRENFMFNFHQPSLIYMTQEEENFSKNFARFVNEANVIEITELLEKAQRDIGQNANGKIVFFDLALKMIIYIMRK